MFPLSPRVATYVALVVGACLMLANVVLLSWSSKLDEEDAEEEEREKEWANRRLVSQKQLLTGRFVEICVSDIEAAIDAVAGGATSLELCSNRLEGGVTPSVGFIQQAVAIFQSTNVAVHVLVRPRQGDFVYSSTEFEVLIRDVLMCKSQGVDGIVTGILTPQGTIDVARMQIVRELCHGMLLTFHRAFDVMPSAARGGLDLSNFSLEHDYWQAVDLVGCDRLLTSGRAQSCMAGQAELRRLADEEERLAALEDKGGAAAAGVWEKETDVGRRGAKVTVAAAGITAQTVRPLILSTRVQAVHLGSGVCVIRGPAQGGAVGVGAGSRSSGDECWEAVSRERVEQVVAAAHEAWLELDAIDAEAAARADAADKDYAHVLRDPLSASALDLDGWTSESGPVMAHNMPVPDALPPPSEASLSPRDSLDMGPVQSLFAFAAPSPRDSLESLGRAQSADSLDGPDGPDGFVIVQSTDGESFGSEHL